MKPTMLVSGGDTPLGNSIIQKALADGFNVVATTPSLSYGKPSRDHKEIADDSGSLVLVPWGRTSPVSARNVVLRALSVHNGIDQAIILHNLTNERRAIHELPIAQIQEIADVELKSHLFLVKEVVAHFFKRRAGVLSMVVDRGGQAELTTMDSLVTHGFVAFAKSLMTGYRDEPIVVNGFDSNSNDADGYAAFILSTLNATLNDPERSGKWFQYTVRGGLFRGGFRSKVRH